MKLAIDSSDELYVTWLILRLDMEHSAHINPYETYDSKFDSTIYTETKV